MVKVCCVCRKIEQEGQWLGDPASVGRKISHVYCPACFDDLMDAVDRYALRKWNRSVYTVIDVVQVPGA